MAPDVVTSGLNGKHPGFLFLLPFLMIKFFLVRHGETQWNKQEIFRGLKDIPLNKTGLNQARALAQNLKNIPLDLILSSPLKRARQTAQEISKLQGIQVRNEPTFIDINFGLWQGVSKALVKEIYPRLYRQWLTQPHKVKFPKGETLYEARQRVVRTLMKLARQNQAENVLIATHRVICKIILCIVMGRDNSHFWRIKQDTTALNIFSYNNKKWLIERLNDTLHLK
ncbi:histidine phosphatase family protein [Planctomycetota bacterium]